MALPAIYLDAAVLTVTWHCPERAAFGVGFDVPGSQHPVRLALPRADAEFLAQELARYLALPAGAAA